MVKVRVSAIDVKSLKGAVVLFATKDGKLTAKSASVDKAHKGIISDAMKASRFTGAADTTYTLPTPQLDDVHAFVVVGLGDASELTLSKWRLAMVKATNAIEASYAKEAAVMVEKLKGDKSGSLTEIATALVEGANLAVYKFDQFKTGQKPTQKPSVKKLNVQMDDGTDFKKQLPLIEGQTEGANLARTLVNLPANYANPDYMVEQAKLLKKDGVKVKVLGEKEMTKLGLNLLLAVGRASKQESRLIIMKYMGDPSSKELKCLVGKGVMFDTGGYNMKPGAGMEWMKADMAGAAAVMGTIKSLAMRKSKVNVVAVCGCVVNMIGGDAFLPSDILTSYLGKTVEIGNTDAEGRLVLADAMAYTIATEKPTEVIDVATLTGACMVALGGFYAGIFSNNDNMAKHIQNAGDHSGERLWRLPIDDGYAAKPKLADLNNDGSRWGGASTAAVFLKNFNAGLPWAHLDIAGVGIGEKIPGTAPVAGSSGFGVRLLTKYYENV
jgi:leucyl aminopeptidase